MLGSFAPLIQSVPLSLASPIILLIWAKSLTLLWWDFPPPISQPLGLLIAWRRREILWCDSMNPHSLRVMTFSRLVFCLTRTDDACFTQDLKMWCRNRWKCCLLVIIFNITFIGPKHCCLLRDLLLQSRAALLLLHCHHLLGDQQE